MAAADNIVPAYLGLAMCLTRPILGHPAGQGRQIGSAGWHQNSALSVMCDGRLLVETPDYFR